MNATTLTAHEVKALEYLVAVTYLVLFVPFWRFATGADRKAAARASVKKPAPWFSVPDGLRYHVGHTWARPDDGLVAVGMDDFARKLVGPLDGLRLPDAGQGVRQGVRAVELLADSRRLALLSPLDGHVVEVNPAAAASAALGGDPYANWLFKVRPRQWAVNAKQLLSGDLARRWMQGVTDRLRAEMSPALGELMQDGGQPVHGIAKELRGEAWDEWARSFFLTDGRG
jgi:glycine cleavage system H lipoate-binding protein